MEELEEAILRTLIYAGIFDYPLDSTELYRFLITEEPLTPLDFDKLLPRIVTNDSRISTNENCFFLKGREKLVALRKNRERWSQEKFLLAQKIGQKLKLIPWVKLVGVTGALAVKNAARDDDIDLLIVAGSGRLWSTRLLAVLLMELMGVRRRPKEKDSRNKICLNLFLDENHLVIPVKERNLYTAHEVVQMKPLWEKQDTYNEFLWENRWARTYLPNGIDTKMLEYYGIKRRKGKSLNICLDFLETIAYKIQLVYMKPRKTVERVSENRAFFHPEDCSGWVMGEYNDRVKEMKCL